MPSAPGAPFAPLPALNATRSSLTVEDAAKAAMLELPGAVASGAANDMSSIVTEPSCTPVTKSAYAEGGAITCARCPTYDQTRPAEPAPHDRPPYTLTAAVMLTCS